MFPLQILSDGSWALAVPLLQVSRHSPAVCELHIAEFTAEGFPNFWMVVYLMLQSSFLGCESFLALVAVELSCQHPCWVASWTPLLNTQEWIWWHFNKKGKSFHLVQMQLLGSLGRKSTPVAGQQLSLVSKLMILTPVVRSAKSFSTFLAGICWPWLLS